MTADHQHQSADDSDPTQMLDSSQLTFSQAQGLEELPQPLALNQISKEARNLIWAVFWRTTQRHSYMNSVMDPWRSLLLDVHVRHLVRPVDEFRSDLSIIRDQYKNEILDYLSYNQLFDLLQHILRHENCPDEFSRSVGAAFSESRLAYFIDASVTPTIVPKATPEEGTMIRKALRDLSEGGFGSAAQHLLKAGALINEGDWAGSVRESIHAVESVARRLDPSAAGSLGPAIDRLKMEYAMHPALASACKKLYGYTSNEQGIRHAMLDNSSQVGQEEAVFLFGACASFASYLYRKGDVS